jgi:type II secretory pathway component PulF
MNDPQRDNVSSAIFWTTAIAIAAHGVVWFMATAALFAIPSFIRIFEDFDAQLPAMTVLVINICSAFGSFWYIIPLLALGLFAADGWIFYRLFRNPAYRFLAVLWFFAVLLLSGVVAAFVTIALFFPLVELIQKLS